MAILSIPRMMRGSWSLVGQRPDFPGALDPQDLQPEVQIIRHLRNAGAWHDEMYRVVCCPRQQAPRPNARYFLGGGQEVHLRPMGAGLRPGAIWLDLGEMGILPYRTIEGPLWTTAAYTTLAQ
jgi:hypothetical protein